MKKYWQLIKITFEEYFEYRLNFLLWRLRNLISFLTLTIFWLALSQSEDTLFGYRRSELLTYVVGVAFLRGFVLASRSVDLAGQIRSGELTKILLKPIEMFKYWFTRDLVDKTLNLFFVIFEVGIITRLIGFSFIFPSNSLDYLLFGFLLVLSTFLYFFLSFLLSVFAFWTEDIWATRWLFGIVFLEFFSGAYFPIDVLPGWLSRIIYLTPFPYLIYFPLKIWLGQVSIEFAFRIVVICLFWLIIFFGVSNFLWKKGIKDYGAYGG